MTALKPSEVLSKAADLIEPEGAWTQREFQKTGPDGSVARCLVCALSQVKRRNIQPELVWMGRGLFSAIRWNDDPATTQPEVVAALRKAADLARSEGQ